VCVSAHNLKSFNLVSLFFCSSGHDSPWPANVYTTPPPPQTKLPKARATATDCSHVGDFVLFLLTTTCSSSSCQETGGVVRAVREQDSRKSSH
jgi:hypothetical protein